MLLVAQIFRFLSFEYTIDDAWISFRYARHWAEAGELSYNLGQPAVEGFSNPLWAALAAAWIMVVPSVEPIIAARFFGLVCALAAVGIVTWTVGRLNPQPANMARGVTLLLLASSGCLWFYAMAGLETALWCLLWAALLCICLLPETPLLRRIGPPLIVLLVWCRPEALALGAVVIMLSVLVSGRRRAIGLLLAYLFALGTLLTWRHLFFGSWLPNTYYAKPAIWQDGVEHFGTFLLWGLGAVGWSIVLMRRLDRPVLALLAVAATTGVLLVVSGGDWMPGWRRWLIVELTLVLAVGLQWRIDNSRTWLRVLLLGIWLGVHLLAVVTVRDAARFPPDHMARLGVRAQASGLARVALMDIGQFGWAFRGQIIDLAGLTDAHLARQPGLHLQKADPDYVLSKRPDIVLIQVYADPDAAHPLDGLIQIRSEAEYRLLVSLAARNDYRMYTLAMINPRIGLAVFARSDVALPEALWGPDWDSKGDELLSRVRAH